MVMLSPTQQRLNQWMWFGIGFAWGGLLEPPLSRSFQPARYSRVTAASSAQHSSPSSMTTSLFDSAKVTVYALLVLGGIVYMCYANSQLPAGSCSQLKAWGSNCSNLFRVQTASGGVFRDVFNFAQFFVSPDHYLKFEITALFAELDILTFQSDSRRASQEPPKGASGSGLPQVALRQPPPSATGIVTRQTSAATASHGGTANPPANKRSFAF